ncbi:MAG TPA: hypothetical protein VMS09_06030 [Paenibacillus sp.]|uniref:hypothetical protein n=1 Tax=Paenibacillus sp. TaxID=58172 RepID=UPI0028D07ECB|nr:hypothetical protein [Paenibacillus sp.]HUC91578.1 hypothetical protein [Paenibacillus sp.]
MFQLAVAVREREYIRRLADYIRSSPFGQEWRVTGFSSAASLKQYLKGGYPVDLLLVQPWLAAEAEAHGAGIPKALLVRRAGEAAGAAEGWTEVLQFQAVPRLLRQLTAVRAEGGGTVVRLRTSGAGRTAVIAVYSPVGGIGKTTAALNLVHQAALQGKNVFYLNLEPFDATGLLLGAGGSKGEEGLSGVLYALKSHPGEAGAAFKRLRRHHSVLKADYFAGDTLPEEKLALPAEDTSQLLETIAESGDYDLVVVDLDSAFREAHMAVFERSRHILWLVSQELPSLRKTESALAFARRAWPERFGDTERNIRYIACRHMESEGAAGSSVCGNLPVFGKLPYVSEWRMLEQPGRLLASRTYRAAAAGLLGKMGLKGEESGDRRGNGAAVAGPY